jgi:hypothetical protein
VQRLRKVVKGHGLVFLLGEAPDSLWIEFAVLGECSQPVGSTPLPWWAGPKCQPARSQRPGARAWERRSRRCAAYAPDTAFEGLRERALALPKASRHARRFR